ncbi:hypothetical protein EMCRGX_G029830 [Ephydatia muelleri]
MAESAKPRVLILGGVGFVGRNLTSYLVKNELVSKVRVVDKVPPATGWLNEDHKAIFKSPIVEFKSANLANNASCSKVFHDDSGAYDVVFNLATETKCGQTDEVYKERVLDVTVNCATEAAAHGTKRFIQMSCARVYDCDKEESREDGALNPWTQVDKFRLKSEEALAQTEGLDYVIVRPATIYGIGDKQGLTPRLIIGAVYKELNEKMKLLWTADLRMNTVHISDVCRALWHLRNVGQRGEIFNLCDKGHTTQGVISTLVSELFQIEHDYFGTILSNLARVNMTSAVEESNEKHLAPWSTACTRDGIENTPLSPYIDKELLYNKHLSVNGTKIESTGFRYEVPEVNMKLLKEIVEDYVTMNIFPPSLVPWKILA